MTKAVEKGLADTPFLDGTDEEQEEKHDNAGVEMIISIVILGDTAWIAIKVRAIIEGGVLPVSIQSIKSDFESGFYSIGQESIPFIFQSNNRMECSVFNI
ncbi:MAG: hypothetical protein ACOC55_02475 [Candidatus Natronoplasma sp.]